ncbi:MAG: hypothetical protein R3F48_09470 [Candidatus Zixiibacteriota bacterium]
MKKAVAIFFIICFGLMILIESNLCSWCNPDKEACLFSQQTAETDQFSCAGSCSTPCGSAQETVSSPCEKLQAEPSPCSGCPSKAKKTYTTPCGKVIEIEEEVAPPCQAQAKPQETNQKCSSCPLYGKSGGCPTCILSKLNSALTFQVTPNFRLTLDPAIGSTLFGVSQLETYQAFTIHSTGVHPTISSTVLRC